MKKAPARRIGATDSLDHFVGPADQRQREGKTERLGGLEIYDELDFGDLLYREVGGLITLEDLSNKNACAAIPFGNVGSVAHETADVREGAPSVDRRHRVLGRQLHDLGVLGGKKRVDRDDKTARFQPLKQIEGDLDFACGTGPQHIEMHPKRLSRLLRHTGFGLMRRIARIDEKSEYGC